jgi:hypothetical protein
MTLQQFIDRIRRRQPTYSGADLSESARAFIEARRHDLDGWTEEELDEHARRTLEGHEAELREALTEGDEMREWIRNHRWPTSDADLSEPARAYIKAHKRALEGWTDDDLLALERRSAAGHESEIQQAFREGDEMRDWIRLHRP